MISLHETIDELERDGYGADFYAEGGELHVAGSNTRYDPADVISDRTIRLDVDTDPADQVIVYALRSRSDGVRGTYVAAFGPEMAAADVAVVQRLPRAARR